jgi:hypothetical protein
MRDNTENKQRLADYRLERAVWPDANLWKEPEEISFEHLGGRKLLGSFVPDRSAKPVDLSAAYGDTGKLVCNAPEANSQTRLFERLAQIRCEPPFQIRVE